MKPNCSLVEEPCGFEMIQKQGGPKLCLFLMVAMKGGGGY